MSSRILDSISHQPRPNLHTCSSWHVDVSSLQPPDLIICSRLTCLVFDSLAEVATLILVTCFPLMPRFTQLVLSKTSYSLESKSSAPYQATRKKADLSSGGSHSLLHDGSETRAKRWDAMSTRPGSAYIPLVEHDRKRIHNSGMQEGIKRTVEIELSTSQTHV